jgi:hypothetical protein
VSRRVLLAAALLLAFAGTARAQQISIDRGLRAAGLWCFPLVTDAKTYVYLPASAHLAEDDAGKPQFSFVRYVVNAPASAGAEGGATITEAGGGGILHFLVLYETPQAAVDAAQAELRRILDNDEVRLRGPVVFQDGRYALVSSILNPAGGPPEKALLAAGRAPVLEGNRLALSFDLDPRQASLLLESFRMATPDVSLVFDMTFAGLTDAYDAQLTVDWSEVRQSAAFGAGGSIYFVSADVDTMFDDLRKNNAIKLRSSGSDSSMEALLETVYGKLLDLLFRTVEPDRIPEDQRGGLADALSAIIDPKSGPLSARRTTGFGAYVGYQLKDLKSSGVTVLDFNHRSSAERHSFIAFNIGDLHKRYGNNPEYFRPVNLSDPTFQQREVVVGVDGSLIADFGRYVNSVTVTLRKQHPSGRTTVRELVVDPAILARPQPDLRLVYGWDGDDDRLAWLRYEYRAAWSFKGGGSYQTGWTPAEAPMIELFAPFERRTVQVVGDRDTLLKKGVRAVVVQVEHPFFGGVRRQQMLIKTDRPLEEPEVEITLPANQFEYDYTITWQLDGGRRLTSRGKDGSGLVFIDEPPGV